MQLSARNQIPARATGIHQGEAIANVELDANGVRLVASSASPSAIRASVSPVAGLGVSKVFPDAAATHCPSMNSWRGAATNASTFRSRVTVSFGHLPCRSVVTM